MTLKQILKEHLKDEDSIENWKTVTKRWLNERKKAVRERNIKNPFYPKNESVELKFLSDLLKEVES